MIPSFSVLSSAEHKFFPGSQNILLATDLRWRFTEKQGGKSYIGQTKTTIMGWLMRCGCAAGSIAYNRAL
jgi:hypothetical protein